MKNIYLIGSGKIGNNIATTLNDNQIKITGIHSRNIKTGNKLAKKINSIFFEELIIPKKTELIIICVTDDQIKNVAKKINKIPIVHTSGSSDIKLLKNCSENYGVVWPIQTFTNNKKTNFKKTPICIEASNLMFYEKLNILFGKISNNIVGYNFKQRKLIHRLETHLFFLIMSSIKSQNNLDEIENELKDRFGKFPEELINLIKSIKVKWIGEKLGFKKIIIKKGKMIIFLPKKNDNSFYNSSSFNIIINKIKSQPSFCMLKEKNNQINLYINQKVDTINQAEKILKSF